MMNCYIFEDENIGVVGVMAKTEAEAITMLENNTDISSNPILLDCIPEDDKLFDEMLDSYGCDVL